MQRRFRSGRVTLWPDIRLAHSISRIPARQSISGKAIYFRQGSSISDGQELKLSGIKSLRSQVPLESSLSGTKLSGLQGCKSDLFLASSLNQNRFRQAKVCSIFRQRSKFQVQARQVFFVPKKVFFPASGSSVWSWLSGGQSESHHS